MKSGGRKVFGSLLVLGCGVLITGMKGDVPPNFLQLLQTVYLAFIVGNGTEHLTAMIKGISEARASIKKLELTSHSEDEHEEEAHDDDHRPAKKPVRKH